MKMYIDMKIV